MGVPLWLCTLLFPQENTVLLQRLHQHSCILGASGTDISPHWVLCWFLFLMAIELQHAKGIGLEVISKEYLHCSAVTRQPGSLPSSSAPQTLWCISVLLILLVFYFLFTLAANKYIFFFSCTFINFTVKLHKYHSYFSAPFHITFWFSSCF